jgi:predicted HicB family RNase H-like nuclease
MEYRQIGVRLPPDLAEWVQEQAEADERSINQWLFRLIRQAKADADADQA